MLIQRSPSWSNYLLSICILVQWWSFLSIVCAIYCTLPANKLHTPALIIKRNGSQPSWVNSRDSARISGRSEGKFAVHNTRRFALQEAASGVNLDQPLIDYLSVSPITLSNSDVMKHALEYALQDGFIILRVSIYTDIHTHFETLVGEL